jgi:hypothetical protein
MINSAKIFSILSPFLIMVFMFCVAAPFPYQYQNFIADSVGLFLGGGICLIIFLKLSDSDNQRRLKKIHEQDRVWVTHRTTPKNLAKIFQDGTLQPRNVQIDGHLLRPIRLWFWHRMDDKHPVIWVTLGHPTKKFLSSMFLTGRSNNTHSQAITFAVAPHEISFPTGFKRVFGYHQVVLRAEVKLNCDTKILNYDAKLKSWCEIQDYFAGG